MPNHRVLGILGILVLLARGRLHAQLRQDKHVPDAYRSAELVLLELFEVEPPAGLEVSEHAVGEDAGPTEVEHGRVRVRGEGLQAGRERQDPADGVEQDGVTGGRGEAPLDLCATKPPRLSLA